MPKNTPAPDLVAAEAQKRFDETYITSAEVGSTYNANRVTILEARRKGLLPGGVSVNGGIFIWERAFVAPHLERWSSALNARRGYGPAK